MEMRKEEDARRYGVLTMTTAAAPLLAGWMEIGAGGGQTSSRGDGSRGAEGNQTLRARGGSSSGTPPAPLLAGGDGDRRDGAGGGAKG
ncbi:hypothetical protein OsI_13068 [Oryza sativa Indica Group]|jgi:hypothetical protein|uniref:Uncharacterized protein n=1 Tax=Oryza sativa subsp. indica TaxID=39946 RepID=A2XKT0_ORYSI|nr:hypothetical protein OsI_13068 [Oryza sativa Indica Group]